MKIMSLFLATVSACLSACKESNKVRLETLPYKEVVLLNNFADTCIFFKNEAGDTLSFHRSFEILENTFSDTMNIAFNRVIPGTTGKYFHGQVDTLNSAIYNSYEYRKFLEDGDRPGLYTQWLCFYNLDLRWWGKKKGAGKMRLRVYYKPAMQKGKK